MDASEMQARAIIAAALITSHAVELPAIRKIDHWSMDPASRRLRELTEVVYRTITDVQPGTA